MKVYSTVALTRTVVGVLLVSWLLALMIITANHSLSCVNSNGCLRSICNYDWLKPAYQNIVKANSYKCAYQNTTANSTNSTS